MGDSSDNIRGVKGIGEKTALKLLQEYESVEGIYENIEEIKGPNKQKLIDRKESEFKSKEMATIYNEIPVEYSLEELKDEGSDLIKSKETYEDLEFHSFLKNMTEISDENKKEGKIEYKVATNIEEIKLKNKISLYIELNEKLS